MEMNTATSPAVAGTAAAGRRSRPGRMRGNPTATLLTVALGVMMVALDGTIVAVANPAIQSHLHASLAGIQWVTNAYLLALAVSLITIGKFGDRFGPAMQLGGTLGTAVLGAVMSAKISSLLPARWHAAHLPALTGSQLTGVKTAISVGVAPVTPNTPPRVASVITQISHDTFVSGMHAAFLVAAVAALAGAAIALLTKRGTGDAEAHAGA
jgi:MFS family permease